MATYQDSTLMTPDELERIVGARYPTRRKKDEVCLETCVFCGNTKANLELNAERGVYHCWSCSASGTVRDFLQAYCNMTVHVPVNYESAPAFEIPKDHQDLLSVPAMQVESAVTYLKRRGISLGEILKYDIRFCTEPEGHMRNRILLPVREYYSQALYGYVGRAYAPGQKPKYWATFNARLVAGFRTFRSGVTVMVEGIFDGMAVHRAGYNAAVLLGVDTALPVLDYWAARLPEYETIVVLLDGEARDRTEQYYWHLQRIRDRVLKFVLPPNMDPAMLEPRALTTLVTTIMQQEARL